MTLILELDGETEARLKAQAEARGMAVEVFAESVLRNSDAIYGIETKKQTVEGFEAMFRALAEGSETRPHLPPEAFERDSFYEDRW